MIWEKCKRCGKTEDILSNGYCKRCDEVLFGKNEGVYPKKNVPYWHELPPIRRYRVGTNYTIGD